MSAYRSAGLLGFLMGWDTTGSHKVSAEPARNVAANTLAPDRLAARCRHRW